MLGAVQFIPLFEVGQANFRDGSATLAEIRGWAFPHACSDAGAARLLWQPSRPRLPRRLQRERVPLTINYYGNPNPHGAGSSSWGIKNYVEGGIYLGILPLLLALLAALRLVAPCGSVGDRPANRPDDALFSPWTFFLLLGLLSGFHLRHAALRPALLRAALHQPAALTVPLDFSALPGRRRPGCLWPGSGARAALAEAGRTAGASLSPAGTASLAAGGLLAAGAGRHPAVL